MFFELQLKLHSLFFLTKLNLARFFLIARAGFDNAMPNSLKPLIKQSFPEITKNKLKSLISQVEYPSSNAADILFVIGCNEGESKRYRVNNLCEFGNGIGIKCLAIELHQLPKMILAGFSAESVVIFRAANSPILSLFIRKAQKQGIPVIFDVDDLIFEPESIHFVRAIESFNKSEKRQYLEGVIRYRKAMSICDSITCSTSYLAGRARQIGRNAVHFNNSINYLQLDIAQKILQTKGSNSAIESQQVLLGYFSGTKTHQKDFAVAEEAIIEVIVKYPNVKILIVGYLDLGPRWEKLLDRVIRKSFCPYSEMLEVLSRVDINLAPLEMGNPYCESKSQLKIFEAGLLEVPTIASKTKSYSEAIDDGVNGFLAANFEDWQHQLETLITDGSFRREMGRRARLFALNHYSIDKVGPEALKIFYPKLTAERMRPVNQSSNLKGTSLKIAWIVPDFIPESGGHRNIMRAAYYLATFGHEISIYYTNTEIGSADLYEKTRKHFYQIDGRIERYSDFINSCDVLFATHWTTVEIALRHSHIAKRIFYFVQDFEPFFAPMSTEYILSENTYRKGLYHVTSGPWCEKILRSQYGAKADHFGLPVDKSIYKPRTRKKITKNVVFFGRPEMPRRCFDLGLIMLTKFNQIMPDVEIIVFGASSLNKIEFPFPVTVKAFIPTLGEISQMYSDSDVGICFSTTNPSLVPYEMMAAGTVVLDIDRPGAEVNYGGAKNVAFLADPDPAKMAFQLAELLRRPDELAARRMSGLALVGKMPDELEMAKQVEHLILKEFIGSESDLNSRSIGNEFKNESSQV